MYWLEFAIMCYIWYWWENVSSWSRDNDIFTNTNQGSKLNFKCGGQCRTQNKYFGGPNLKNGGHYYNKGVKGQSQTCKNMSQHFKDNLFSQSPITFWTNTTENIFQFPKSRLFYIFYLGKYSFTTNLFHFDLFLW